jgi:hypothetical protein
MELPITESELLLIMQEIKNKDKQLYNKLWSFRINHKQKQKHDSK